MDSAHHPRNSADHGPTTPNEQPRRLPKRRLPEDILRFARELRREQTQAEAKLWRLLRERQFGGLKFRRQHPVGGYIVDFYCHERKLVIELDGGQHDEKTQIRYDMQRTRTLEDLGVRVLRFWNSDVSSNLIGVLQTIWDAIDENGESDRRPVA